MAEIEEKVFNHFLKFSPKVRMMVIIEMEPADRCRLTRCSKMCSKEAKALKNYTYGLDIFYNPNGSMRIEVMHGKDETVGRSGYILDFSGRSETKFRRYLNQRDETLWETELDSSTDVAQLALEEFKNIIQRCQKTIKSLRVCIVRRRKSTKNIGIIDFGIESLDSLDHLIVRGKFDVQNLLSKLREPLKTLNIDGYEKSGILDHEPIYQVQEDLTWFCGKLDNNQFLQLSAKNVVISIGKLTERNIVSFIKSWQNGTIGKEIGRYYWSLDNSDFNIHQLLKLLRIRDYNGQREPLEIKHFEEAGKLARLYVSEFSIQLFVQQ